MSQDLPDGELSLESATNSGQSSTLGLTLISLSSTPEPTPVDSGAPYDDTDADLILRSSDLVDFRVYKVVLAKASPVFKVLLSGSPKSDAKTPSIALSGESKDGCSVICLPENKDVLESLLSAILPVPVVIPGNLNRLLPILAAAQKYNMNAALASLRSTTSHVGVVDKTPEDAFRTYCHAQQLGLLEESIKAAKATLPRKLSIESLGSDLRLATGPALDKLHRFHTSIAQRANVSLRTVLVASQTMWVADAASKKTRCRETTAGPLTHDIPYWFAQFVLRNIHDDFPAPPSYTSFLLALVLHCHKGFCRYCTSLSASFLEKVWGDLSACISAPVTLAENIFDLPEHTDKPDGTDQLELTEFGHPFNEASADVILRANDRTDFRVHKLVLGIASPVFQAMFTLPQPFSSPNSGLTQIADEKKGLPIVHMAENSKILSSLLMAVYSPAITSMPSCLEDAFELLNAAQKFGMDDTTSLIRILLSHNDRTPLITPDNAVRAYGLAKFHSLAIEALLAARCTLHLPCSLEFYAPNLRILDGASIYELACYRARCRDAVLGCIEAARSGKLPSADKWLAPAPNVDGQSSTCKSLKEPGATPEVPTWWDQHLERLAEGVKEGTRHPSAKTVVNLVALQAALDKHVEDESCEYCRRVYVRREEKFCTMLEDEINDAIQKVQLDLPW